LDNGETKKTPIVIQQGEQLYPWMLEQLGEEVWSVPEEDRLPHIPPAEAPVDAVPVVPKTAPSPEPTAPPSGEPGQWRLRAHLDAMGSGQDYLLPPGGEVGVPVTDFTGTEPKKPDDPRLNITKVVVREVGNAVPSNVVHASQNWSIHIDWDWASSGAPDETLETYHYAHNIDVAAGEVAAGKYRLVVTVVYQTEAGKSVPEHSAGVFGPELDLL
jgi:hypothetical protein